MFENNERHYKYSKIFCMHPGTESATWAASLFLFPFKRQHLQHRRLPSTTNRLELSFNFYWHRSSYAIHYTSTKKWVTARKDGIVPTNALQSILRRVEIEKKLEKKKLYSLISVLVRDDTESTAPNKISHDETKIQLENLYISVCKSKSNKSVRENRWICNL